MSVRIKYKLTIAISVGINIEHILKRMYKPESSAPCVVYFNVLFAAEFFFSVDCQMIYITEKYSEVKGLKFIFFWWYFLMITAKQFTHLLLSKYGQ